MRRKIKKEVKPYSKPTRFTKKQLIKLGKEIIKHDPIVEAAKAAKKTTQAEWDDFDKIMNDQFQRNWKWIHFTGDPVNILKYLEDEK